MAVRAALFFSVAFLSFGGSFAQDDPAAGQDEKFVLIEPPKSIEEALERQKAAEAAAAAKLAEAEAAYAAEVEKANKQLALELEQLAKQAVANGNLPDAAKAWEKVLQIIPDSKDAIEFFKTIGKADVISRAANSAAGREEINALMGKWEGVWGTSRNRIQFEVSPEGRMSTGEDLQIEDGRILWLPRNGAEHVQLIPDGDRILVLGWTRASNRMIKNRTKTIVAVPDHVGVAWRRN